MSHVKVVDIKALKQRTSNMLKILKQFNTTPLLESNIKIKKKLLFN